MFRGLKWAGSLIIEYASGEVASKSPLALASCNHLVSNGIHRIEHSRLREIESFCLRTRIL